MLMTLWSTSFAGERATTYSKQHDIECSFNVLHCNIRGFITNHAELIATINGRSVKPTVVLLNETKAPEGYEMSLPSYSLISARNRRDFNEDFDQGGGICVFVHCDFEHLVTAILKSAVAERIWLCVQTCTTRLLLCCWYRRPEHRETRSIASLEAEYKALSADFNFTAIIGDANVHEPTWLVHSTHTSPEGSKLREFSYKHCLPQLVQSPTREGNLLDLVLTDASKCKCTVFNQITDHSCVHIAFDFSLQARPPLVRHVWRWDLAEWDVIHDRLNTTNWFYLVEQTIDDAAEWFQDQLGDCLDELVPKQRRHFQAKGHPWVTPSIVKMVMRKHVSTGTALFRRNTLLCNQAIWGSYKRYAAKTKGRLHKLKKGCKAWWSQAKRATNQLAILGSIGPLKHDNVWVTEDGVKCGLLKETFAAKYTLPEAANNDFTVLPDRNVNVFAPNVEPLDSVILSILLALRINSATGPDLIPAHFLKACFTPDQLTFSRDPFHGLEFHVCVPQPHALPFTLLAIPWV